MNATDTYEKMLEAVQYGLHKNGIESTIEYPGALWINLSDTTVVVTAGAGWDYGNFYNLIDDEWVADEDSVAEIATSDDDLTAVELVNLWTDFVMGWRKMNRMNFTNNGWVCVAECGNLPEWDGFEPCTREGVVVDLEGDYRYVKCGKCGRIADTATFEVVGRA